MGESPAPKGEAFDGQAIACAIAMTWERTTIRTMSFRSVTTLHNAFFMGISVAAGRFPPEE